jgi:hypothetical protein
MNGKARLESIQVQYSQKNNWFSMRIRGGKSEKGENEVEHFWMADV